MSKQVRGRGVIDLRKRRVGINIHPRAAPLRKEKESLRSRRRKLRALAVLALLCLTALLVWGVGRLSYSSNLLINNVSVVGTKAVPPKLIHAYVETKLNDGTYPVLSRENIFLYPKRVIEEAVKKYFPRIREVSISRESMLAQAIKVTVEERQPFALWCGEDSVSSDGKCYLMDDTGFIFAPALPFSDKVYMQFEGYVSATSSPIAQMFLPMTLGGVLDLIKRLHDAGFSALGAIAENEKDVAIRLQDGFVLRALFGNDPKSIVRNLQLAFSSEQLRGKADTLEYVDLRFGNRVYYRFKSGQ